VSGGEIDIPMHAIAERLVFRATATTEGIMLSRGNRFATFVSTNMEGIEADVRVQNAGLSICRALTFAFSYFAFSVNGFSPSKTSRNKFSAAATVLWRFSARSEPK